MLAVSSPLGCGTGKDEMQNDYMNGVVEEEFCDFGGGNLLDSINFDDLFLVGINDEDDDDLLPDLEMDPEILAQFSTAEESEITTTSTSVSMEKIQSANEPGHVVDKVNHLTSSDIGSDSISTQKHQQDVNPAAEKRRKSSSKTSGYAHGKRKVKVEWTPELHRRFVEAVEQLGVEKAVPSRILELMGIHCLTRHNIASHLQKYRSHLKHLLAREIETANWTHKRRLYSTPVAGGKRDVNAAWPRGPTLCFPPMAAPPPFKPLHVWGHPSVNHPLMHVWPKHLRPSSTLPSPPVLTWPSAAVSQPPPMTSGDPSLWHSQYLRSSLTPGTPCFPPHLMRYPVPPVPGIPPPTMYKMEPSIGVPTSVAGQVMPQPPFDFHPSKESLDAAIGDVLSKPWLPLPLGLKPPSVDGVLVQLQRQGVPKIPPSGGDG